MARGPEKAQRARGVDSVKDTFRVRASSDRTVLTLAPVVNGNQEALAELQGIVRVQQTVIAALQAKLAKLEKASA